jgi:hypothetical protein
MVLYIFQLPAMSGVRKTASFEFIAMSLRGAAAWKQSQAQVQDCFGLTPSQ